MRDESGPPPMGYLTATLAAAALAAAALLAACGGGSPSAAASPGKGQITVQTLDIFAKCMRDHGLPDFYFSRQGSSSASSLTDAIKLGPWVAPADPGSPVFQSAQKACRHLLPIPNPSQAQLQAQLRSLDKQAACMRSHGYPDYPDPTAQGGGILQPDPPADIDTNSPQFQSAMQTCSKG
jgi:hypothetical protein